MYNSGICDCTQCLCTYQNAGTPQQQFLSCGPKNPPEPGAQCGLDAGVTVCTDCRAGKASAQVGATAEAVCASCGAGKYANAATGATACVWTICDGDASLFSVGGTVPLCVSNNIYPSSDVSHCVFDKTWEQLRRMHGLYRTGGLGKLMTLTEYEVWVCVREHPCAQDENDMVCFTYNEKHKIFVPWGLNSVVKSTSSVSPSSASSYSSP